MGPEEMMVAVCVRIQKARGRIHHREGWIMISVVEMRSEKGTSGKMMTGGKGFRHHAGGNGKVTIKC